MAKIGFIDGCFGADTERDQDQVADRVMAILTAARHTVTKLTWQGDLSTALRYPGYDLYVIIRPGGLSQPDREKLGGVIKNGSRVLLLYTLMRSDYEAEGFAKMSLWSTRGSISKAVKRLTSQA